MLTLDDLIVTGRLLSGRPISGEPRTDATFTKPGTQTLNGHRRASRWSFWSHRRRAVTTWTGLVLSATVVAGVVVDLWSVVAVARMVFWLLILPGGLWVTWEKGRRYVHRREVVAPLAEALSARLNDDRYVLDARTWLHVPVDTQDRPTRVYLPVTYDPTPAQEKTLASLVARRVGLAAPTPTWHLKGEAPYLELTPAPAPREVVGFADPPVRALVDAAPEGRPFLGLGPRDVPVEVDLDAESPHVGLSVATGGGKSVLARAIGTQVLHHGGCVLVLDRKVESQLWAVNHPGVRYACSEQEIFDALMDASGEIDRRFELVRARRFAGEPIDREEIGPRLLVICEEVNALEIDLRIWWRARRAPSDPAQCPALPILGRILAMGRAGRVHMIVIAQKLTCQAIGGPAARENLSTRILGRATTSTWNMLAPECKVGGRFPRSSRVRGRVHVVVGDEATATQVVFVDEDDALSYALAGTVTPFPTMGGTPQDAIVRPAGTAGVTPLLSLVEPVEDKASPPVTLAEFESSSGIALRTLRRARERDGRFPEPIESAPGQASQYRQADLDAWADHRAAGVGGGAS